MKKIYTLFILLFIFSHLSAQISFQKVFGGSGLNAIIDVIQISDGGYVATGFIEKQNGADVDVLLLKTDSAGDTLWVKSYGGPNDDGGRSVVQTSDGGFIICGFTLSFGDHAYVIKTDATGNLEWANTYAGPTNEEGNNIITTSDGGYLIAANIYGGIYNTMLIKIDSLGNVTWSKTCDALTNLQETNAILETTDGSYAFMGESNLPTTNSHDIFLIKINSIGDTVWTKSYGSLFNDDGRCFIQTSDGGFLLAGATFGFGFGGNDIYVVKVDSLGNLSWSQKYGGFADDFPYSILEKSNGNFILSGQTESFGSGNEDAFLMEINSSGGLIGSMIYGGSEIEAFRSSKKTTDGGFISCGYTNKPDTTAYFGYLVKINSLLTSGCNESSQTMQSDTINTIVGNCFNLSSYVATKTTAATNVVSGCQVTTICTNIGVDELISENKLTVFPNPFTNTFTVSGTASSGEIYISNLAGQGILKIKSTDGYTIIDGLEISPGFYLIRYTNENKIITGKLTKY